MRPAPSRRPGFTLVELLVVNAVNILGQQGFFVICPTKFTFQKKEIDVMTGSMERRR